MRKYTQKNYKNFLYKSKYYEIATRETVLSNGSQRPIIDIIHHRNIPNEIFKETYWQMNIYTYIYIYFISKPSQKYHIKPFKTQQ